MLIAGTLDRVECEIDPSRLPALAEAWDELIDEGSPGAVFRSSGWLVPWWRHFGHGKQLAVFLARSGDRLMGVLPAYRIPALFGGWQLRLMGDGVATSDYLGIIARPEDLGAVSEVIAGVVARTERDVVFDGVAADAPFVAALRRAALGVRASFRATEAGICPVLTIPEGSDFMEWLERHPDAALWRDAKRFKRRADYRLEVLTTEAEVASALPTFWEMHRARWAEEGGSRALADRAVESFHLESGRALARRGWTRLYMVHGGGAPRAGLYGFQHGDRFSYYQTGADPSRKRWSAGSVVLQAAVEDAFRRGLREFDFLRGEESYKAHYATTRRRLLRVRLASGPRARLRLANEMALEAALQFERESLPEPVRSRLRQVVREARRRVRASSGGAQTVERPNHLPADHTAGAVD